MSSLKAIAAAIRAPFMGRLGMGSPDGKRIIYGFTNAFKQKWRNAADTLDITALQVDSDGRLLLRDEAVDPNWTSITFNLETSASLVDQVFFNVPFACTVEKIEAVHKTANGAAMTATIKKMANGVTLANGTAVMTSTFDMNATADTLQQATVSTARGVADLALNDRLGIDFTGTLTSLAGVQITLTLSPGGKGDIAVYSMNANGDLVAAGPNFHIANRPMRVSAISYSHSTAGTDGSAVNLQVEKCTGTTAAGSGTNLLTNNSNAGFNCKGTINTVQAGTLAAAASLRMAATDRLAIDTAGTLTALAGVVVTVLFEPAYGRKEITYHLEKNGNLIDATFFTADRNYEVVEAAASWGTASSGATNIQLVIDKATDVPGGGTDLLSNDSSAGFQSDGTADTPERATWIDTRENFLLNGDRLSVDYSGTLTGLADVAVTVSLKPV